MSDKSNNKYINNNNKLYKTQDIQSCSIEHSNVYDLYFGKFMENHMLKQIDLAFEFGNNRYINEQSRNLNVLILDDQKSASKWQRYFNSHECNIYYFDHNFKNLDCDIIEHIKIIKVDKISKYLEHFDIIVNNIDSKFLQSIKKLLSTQSDPHDLSTSFEFIIKLLRPNGIYTCNINNMSTYIQKIMNSDVYHSISSIHIHKNMLIIYRS